MSFPTDLPAIEERIRQIDPVKYGSTRNFKWGAVTRLSPYISRGVISTKQVFEHVLSLDLPWSRVEKMAQELAWRDYWQQIWIAKGDGINQDLKHAQHPVRSQELSEAVVQAKTGVEAMDEAIEELYATGYMHNHMRMYVAAVACNMAQSYWKEPARWMYYHLLDGDWASNALSWQWVAGANANKKYVANQENINKYFNSKQLDTFLDVPYAAFANMDCPDVLQQTTDLQLKTKLPESQALNIDPDLPLLVYNYYNLDPNWRKEEQVNRVLLFEPTIFERYPVSQACIEFAIALSRNIPGIQIYVGEYTDLLAEAKVEKVIYKEHSLNKYDRGQEDARDWMFEVGGYYPSFFSFWKKCKKEIKVKELS